MIHYNQLPPISRRARVLFANEGEEAIDWRARAIESLSGGGGLVGKLVGPTEIQIAEEMTRLQNAAASGVNSEFVETDQAAAQAEADALQAEADAIDLADADAHADAQANADAAQEKADKAGEAAAVVASAETEVDAAYHADAKTNRLEKLHAALAEATTPERKAEIQAEIDRLEGGGHVNEHRDYPEGVPAGAVKNDDGTYSMGENKWDANGKKIAGEPDDVPTKVTVTNPNGVPFEVEESKLEDGGTIKGPGGNTWSVTKGKDGKWILSTPQGPADVTSAADTLKDVFGIDNQFIGRTLLYYLGGRLTGGSHAGSLRWAGKQAIKELNTRDATRAKQAGQNTIVSQKNETMVLEKSDGTTQNVTVRVSKTKGGVEQRQVRYNGKWIDESKFYEVLGDNGAALRGFTEGDTGRADVNRWKDIKGDYTNFIHDQFTDDFEDVGKAKGARWADQIASYGRKNLKNSSEESLSEFNQIVYTAVEMASRDQKKNAADHEKGTDVNDIRPYLEMARMQAYTGAGNSIWLTDPKETDPDDMEFVDSSKVNHLMKQIDTLAADNLEGDFTPSQKYLETQDIFKRLYDTYRNPANQAVISKNFGTNIPEGMNEFTYFATTILEDANISDAEAKKYGISKRG